MQKWPKAARSTTPTGCHGLDAVAAAAALSDVVVACSALRRQYRHRLLDGIPGAFFVQLAWKNR